MEDENPFDFHFDDQSTRRNTAQSKLSLTMQNKDNEDEDPNQLVRMSTFDESMFDFPSPPNTRNNLKLLELDDDMELFAENQIGSFPIQPDLAMNRANAIIPSYPVSKNEYFE